jgi:hypothetical protein
VQGYILEADSLGIALLAATAAEELYAELELDAKGGLEMSAGSATMETFEFKTSWAGEHTNCRVGSVKF